jgi:hypothetical protein
MHLGVTGPWTGVSVSSMGYKLLNPVLSHF